MNGDKFEIRNLRLSQKDDFIRLKTLMMEWENKTIKKLCVLPNGMIREEGTYVFGGAELFEDGNSLLLRIWTSFGMLNIHMGDFVEKADNTRLVIRRFSKDPWNIRKDVFRIVEEQ